MRLKVGGEGDAASEGDGESGRVRAMASMRVEGDSANIC